MGEPGGKTCSAASIRGCDCGNAFGEDASLTRYVVAEETAHMETDLNGHAGPGEIGQISLIAAVRTAGGVMAERAGGILGRGGDDHRDGGVRDGEAEEAEVSWVGQEGGGHRGDPWRASDRVSPGARHGVPSNPTLRHHQKGARATEPGQAHSTSSCLIVVDRTRGRAQALSPLAGNACPLKGQSGERLPADESGTRW
jgi:hypothetical protein